MTITYTGTAKGSVVIGNDATTQNLFTVENGFKSYVNVYIRSLIFHSDETAVLISVTPTVKLSRATGISGGVQLEKVSFDTTEISDANVVFRTPVMESGRITAAPGNIIWQNFVNRMHTSAQRMESSKDFNMVPSHAATTGKEFILRPGETILCQLVSPTAASNPAITNNYLVNCNFEEESITTFPISGVITLSSVPLAGAKVMVIEADDINLTNGFLRDTITTPAGGAWSSTIRTGHVGAAFVQYQTGGLYYTAPGSPFLSQ